MNFADDIAYSIFDVIDFYRLLPLDQLLNSEDERSKFLERWNSKGLKKPPEWLNTKKVVELVDKWMKERERMSFKARAQQRARIAVTIKENVESAKFVKTGEYWNLQRNPYKDGEIDFMKRLVFDYLICNPRLTTIQNGQREVIQGLYKYYYHSAIRGIEDNIPLRFETEVTNAKDNVHASSRLACDIICSMGDKEAYEMFWRLTGSKIAKISEEYDW